MTETEQIKSEMSGIKAEISQIHERNRRVEADKAWELSLSRKVLIAILTYIVIVLFFYFAGLPHIFINPIVPTVGFVLSTLSIPLFKSWWVKRFFK